jgi:hypothetical protein
VSGPLLAVALVVAGTSLPGPNAERRGDSLWHDRDRGFALTGQIDPAPAAGAVAAYEDALAGDPRNVRLRFKLLEALYFRGHFALGERSLRKRTFDRMVHLAEGTVALASESGVAADLVEAHFWAAVAWGVWGMEHGYAASGARGVAGKIRDHAEEVARLDPSHRDAAGYRLLGRLHTVTPKVPLVTGWIDRKLGVELLEKALATSTGDPRNMLFLGEALLRRGPRDRARAIELLRLAAERAPGADHRVEDAETIESARRALVDAKKGSR